MHARTIVLALAAAAALALAPAALAKGPTKATLSGPGLASPLTWNSVGDPSGGTSFGTLVEAAGFFPAVFSQVPDPMQDERPAGDLGPRYTLAYVVPGPSGSDARIRQDVYPYAKPSPVTYTAPGQPFFDSSHTRGGWFVAGAALKQTLVEAGLPSTPPSVDSDGWSPLDGPWPIAWAIVLAILAGLGLALVAFRRRTPEPAT
jgi:hypothetical protein